MNESVRRLKKDDLSQMRSLNALFGTVFEDSESYQNNLPSDEYLQRLLANENTIVLVAELDGEVIGGLVAYVLDKFEQERREVYVYDLAVTAQHHRKGVGRRLMDELKKTARELGAYVMFVQADEGDEAVKFYESLAPTENLHTRNFDFDV